MTDELPLPEPAGWVTTRSKIGGGYTNVYSNGLKRPGYGPELNALLPVMPVYTADQLRAAIAADRAQRVGWLPANPDAMDIRKSYLVANAKGEVAPWIRGVIHNNVGTANDWQYGEGITHYMPLPPAPTQTPPATAQTQEPKV